MSNADHQLGQRLHDDTRFSAADQRAFLENLAKRRRTGVAYCGLFGLTCLDASTDAPSQPAKWVTAIDWLWNGICRSPSPRPKTWFGSEF